MLVQNILVNQWYDPKPWGWLLWPLSKIFQLVVFLRRLCYQKGICKSFDAPVPVIIVGNLTVGGTGKTPLIMALADLLKQQGMNPGIVLRGYKRRARGAILVQSHMDCSLVGDEALVLAARSQCLVAVARKRIDGVNLLIDRGVNLILCDDGLQHYALRRDIEVAVIDGARAFGNGHYLPMGPLREPIARLQDADLVLTNGVEMQIVARVAYSLLNPRQVVDLKSFAGGAVHAVAGIGNPARFFESLRAQGLNVIAHEFVDHHEFRMHELNFSDQLPILMTEKDAVKCRAFASSKHWVVPIHAVIEDKVAQKFQALVQGVLDDR